MHVCTHCKYGIYILSMTTVYCIFSPKIVQNLEEKMSAGISNNMFFLMSAMIYMKEKVIKYINLWSYLSDFI